MSKASLGDYETVATEYYDASRHPTCANFSEASQLLLTRWLRDQPVDSGLWCEVGPGHSIVAGQLHARGGALRQLLLVDRSWTMLAYSRKWGDDGAHLILGDATRLPLADGSLVCLVASLGDPYNVPGFWREASRTLRRGGAVLFTVPSYEWAVAFRDSSDELAITSAEFELLGGRTVRVPSWIYAPREQRSLIERAALVVEEVAEVPIVKVRETRLSPKLIASRGPDASVVTGYRVSKPTGVGGLSRPERS